MTTEAMTKTPVAVPVPETPEKPTRDDLRRALLKVAEAEAAAADAELVVAKARADAIEIWKETGPFNGNFQIKNTYSWKPDYTVMLADRAVTNPLTFCTITCEKLPDITDPDPQ